MGYKELIDSLHREGEDRIRNLREETEAEAEKIRTETRIRREQMQKEHRLKQEKEVRHQEACILSRVHGESRRMKVLAENALSVRLFPLALSCLPALRDEEYNTIFPLLVQELPSAQWEEVRINPEDAEISEAHFAGVRTVYDRNITGGYVVRREGGKVIIDNTLEKRLERAWEDLLPLLMKEAGEKVNGTT